MVLRLRIPAPGGWRKAKCLGQVRKDEEGNLYDPFFEEDPAEALEFCNGTTDGQVCPIREACLLFALTNNERLGVWGGMSERDRKAMRKAHPWRGRQGTHPGWCWMPPGEPVKMLKPEQQKELDTDDES